MLTLYSFKRCPFAIRTRLVLEEKQIQYNVIEEDLQNLSLELLSLHPEGKVPLLVHKTENKSLVLYQSSIITEYLDEKFAETKLTPNSPEARAQIRLWTYWCDYIFKTDLDLFKYERNTLNVEDKNQLLTRIENHLNKWDKQLSQSDFLIENTLTLADLHLFPFARQFLKSDINGPWLQKFKSLSKWYHSIEERPSFSRAMGKK